MGLIATTYFWILVSTATFVFTCLNFLTVGFCKITGKLDTSLRIHKIASYWARTIMFLVPKWHINVEGRENLPGPGRACVIVANHESATDILAMYYLGIQFRWLAKKEIFKIPLLGISMKWAGYVPIDRNSRDSHRRALSTSADRLKAGIPMFFFPEGTRSTTGHVGKFKAGAFKLACDSNVPILPICIKGAGNLLEKGRGRPRAATVQVKILPEVISQPNENADDFANRVQKQIVEHHSLLS
jgi:1-acyl-sn-glycerol-3-phosphate acyltransferase